MKHLFNFTMIVAMLSLCGCTNDVAEETDCGNPVRKVHFTVSDFEWGNTHDSNHGPLKSKALNGGNGISFVWSATDTVGIYGNNGSQVEFPIEEGAGSATANFNGGAWALKDNSTYTAYYPFNKYNFDKSRILLHYGMQEQVGNDNVDNLTKYDYIVSTITTPENGELKFQFEHIGCLVRFQLTMPEADDLIEFCLASTEEVFPTEQILNLSGGIPVVTTMERTKKIKVKLSDISVNEGEVVTIYALMPACDLTDKTLTASLTGRNVYKADLDGKDYIAGKAVSHSASLQKRVLDPRIHDYVDLGLSVKWAKNNISGITGSIPFAWGDTETYVTSNEWLSSTGQDNVNLKSGKSKGYVWSNYKYCHIVDDYARFTKYCCNSSVGYDGFVDNKYTLDESDDAATANWGEDWRTPTKEEFEELFDDNNTTISCYDYGKLLITSKKKGYESASILFESVQYVSGTLAQHAGTYGSFWTSSVSKENSDYAYYAEFESYPSGRRASSKISTYPRSYGLAIKPVCK